MTPEQLWQLILAGEKEVPLLLLHDAYLDAGEEKKAEALMIIINEVRMPASTSPIDGADKAYTWYHPTGWPNTHLRQGPTPLNLQHWGNMKERRAQFGGVLVGNTRDGWQIVLEEVQYTVLDFPSRNEAIRAWVECV